MVAGGGGLEMNPPPLFLLFRRRRTILWVPQRKNDENQRRWRDGGFPWVIRFPGMPRGNFDGKNKRHLQKQKTKKRFVI